MHTKLTEAFGIQHPIVCAPMALVTGGRLAAAVTHAGGLGIVGRGYAGVPGGEPDMHAELAHVSGTKLGIGFITWTLARVPHMLDEALEAGATVIVAQGIEAGGHGALRPTPPFVPEIADHLARHAPSTLLLAVAVRGTFSPTGRWRHAVVSRLPQTLDLSSPDLMRSIALPAIEFYKRRISPHKGFCCAYRAHLGRFSCSTLGYRAIRRYGVLKGMAVLRQRTRLCAITQRRFRESTATGQRGSAPCDLPCDMSCVPDCNLPNIDCKGVSRYFNCCDGCACDGPERKKKPQDKDKGAAYVPPARGRAQRQ